MPTACMKLRPWDLDASLIWSLIGGDSALLRYIWGEEVAKGEQAEAAAANSFALDQKTHDFLRKRDYFPWLDLDLHGILKTTCTGF